MVTLAPDPMTTRLPVTPARSGVGKLLAILAFYLTFMLLLAKDWLLGGEMWAEMATNYLANALNPSWYPQFFATDAGYIPLPQRLIAWGFHGLSLPWMPYAYTWTATLLSGLMVGVFSLNRFRAVLASDGLRLAACVFTMCVMGFGTRTFINFTYFGAFYLAVLTALPWTQRLKNTVMPWYAWLMPLLMMSKPGMLAVLPAMLVTAVACKSRSFRWITGVSTVMASLQMAQILVSQQQGVMAAQNVPKPLWERLLAFGAYTAGTFGGFLTGPVVNWGLFKVWPWLPVLVGLGAAVGLYQVCKRNIHSRPAFPMVGIGLSVLGFTTLLNTMTLSTDWNLDLQGLSLLRLTRHVIPAYTGCLLVSLGVLPLVWPWLSRWAGWGIRRWPGAHQATVAFSVWALLSGWVLYGCAASLMPKSPKAYNGYWQVLAPKLATQADVCIPLDPYGWAYGQGRCRPFHSPQTDWAAFDGPPVRQLTVKPRQAVQQAGIQSIGVLVKPDKAGKTVVQGLLTDTMGNRQSVSASRSLPASGGLVLLTLPKTMTGITSLDLKTGSGMLGHLPEGNPAIQWFGLPKH
jgi:hypothetical protein